MSEQIVVSIEGHLGVIALNRPEAINALNRAMIDSISLTLARWRDQDAVRAVLFEGFGPRGFCAGGDVRAARQAVITGRAAEAEAYFAAEYAMNGVIATYPKPVIVLAHGIVMGGGIGIAGQAAFRFTTPDAAFAMPEAGIGFVSDVGVNAILARAPLHRALLFLMSGLPVGPGDALALGLTDAAVTLERMGEIRGALPDAAAAANIETALVALMQADAAVPDEASMCAAADRLQPVLAQPDAEAIVAGVVAAAAAEADLAPYAEALQARSPTSLVAIVASHREARRLQDVDAILELDLRLARLLAGWPDFAEGVRAVLVDKDRQPRWRPAGFAEVDRAAIAAAVAGVQTPVPAAD